ncbi:hypothetical protein, partial [Rhizobium leguminosarum]
MAGAERDGLLSFKADVCGRSSQCNSAVMRRTYLRVAAWDEKPPAALRASTGGKMMTKTPSMEVDRFAAEELRATANISKSASGLPKKQGLYDPRNEHDACGVGFVAHMKGQKSHQIVKDGLFILENLTHRGAVGADPLMGDGAGILVQIPDRFFREE